MYTTKTIILVPILMPHLSGRGAWPWPNDLIQDYPHTEVPTANHKHIFYFDYHHIMHIFEYNNILYKFSDAEFKGA